jgi:hypothetical protein
MGAGALQRAAGKGIVPGIFLRLGPAPVSG